jgi:hypothetical protein
MIPTIDDDWGYRQSTMMADTTIMDVELVYYPPLDTCADRDVEVENSFQDINTCEKFIIDGYNICGLWLAT